MTVSSLSMPVISYSYAVQRKLNENFEAKGDSWADCPIDFLVEKIQEEVVEYLANPNSVGELSDIGAVCSMLYWRLTRNGEKATVFEPFVNENMEE